MGTREKMMGKMNLKTDTASTPETMLTMDGRMVMLNAELYRVPSSCVEAFHCH